MARPYSLTDPVEVQRMVDEYFEDNDHPTITGLARALGFKERKSMPVNAARNDEIGDIVSDAYMRVEEFYEKHLLTSKPTGAIFALKNFGWSDAQQVELTGQVNIPVIQWAKPKL